MDDRFRPIYENIYRYYARPERYRLGPPFAPLRGSSLRRDYEYAARVIYDAIEGIQEELSKLGLPILREDAKCFLMVTFLDMFYLPLYLSAPPRLYGVGNTRELRLDSIVQQDIRTISFAAAQSAIRTDSPVSIHALVDSLPQIWNSLQSGATRIWEGQEERREQNQDG